MVLVFAFTLNILPVVGNGTWAHFIMPTIAMAGALIGAASERAVVLVDGFIATSAALCALRARPDAAPYVLFAHRSQEPGHRLLLEAVDAEPLLDLEMRLGEGTGALLALPLLRASCAMLAEMATFESAGVSGRD
jgi:nicotinate-nucleotide--dimethylbenzimidazole phosphoribosyltransferase